MKFKIIMITLAAGLILSLLVNIIVIYSLISFRANALNIIVASREGLSSLTSEPFTADVKVDQLLPLHLEIPINQTITVPIDTSYSLDTVVHTTINLPLVGPQRIAIPIREEIPLKLDLNLPIQLTIPISTEYHLDAVLPVQVSLPPETLDALEQALQNLEDSLK